MLAGNLHVERHGVLVGVGLQHTHLGAVLADVEREVDQTRFVLLDEGAELLEVLPEVLEFALLYGVRADKDKRFCHHNASFPTLPAGAPCDHCSESYEDGATSENALLPR